MKIPTPKVVLFFVPCLLYAENVDPSFDFRWLTDVHEFCAYIDKLTDKPAKENEATTTDVIVNALMQDMFETGKFTQDGPLLYLGNLSYSPPMHWLFYVAAHSKSKKGTSAIIRTAMQHPGFANFFTTEERRFLLLHLVLQSGNFDLFKELCPPEKEGARVALSHSPARPSLLGTCLLEAAQRDNVALRAYFLLNLYRPSALQLSDYDKRHLLNQPEVMDFFWTQTALLPTQEGEKVFKEIMQRLPTWQGKTETWWRRCFSSAWAAQLVYHKDELETARKLAFLRDKQFNMAIYDEEAAKLARVSERENSTVSRLLPFGLIGTPIVCVYAYIHGAKKKPTQLAKTKPTEPKSSVPD